jgi:hypothetical protein
VDGLINDLRPSSGNWPFGVDCSTNFARFVLQDLVRRVFHTSQPLMEGPSGKNGASSLLYLSEN